MPRLLLTVLFFALVLPRFAPLRAQTHEGDARVQELYSQAKAAQSQNNLTGAIAKYEEILRIAPRLGPAYNNLGALYFRQRDYQKAAAILEQGLKVDPAMSSAVALLGISLFEMGEYAKARPRLEAALRANAGDTNAQMFLVKDLIKLGDYEAAATQLRHLADAHGKNQLFQQANDLKLRGDARGAIEKDEQALKIYPYFLRALTFMGVVLGENGAVRKGSEVLTFAGQLYPKDSTARFDLGLTLSGPENQAGQIEAFQRAAELDPDMVAVYENLGAALYSAGDWQNAIEACHRGLQVDPLSAKLYFNLSMMLAQHGDSQGSERAKALATKIDPEIVSPR